MDSTISQIFYSLSKLFMFGHHRHKHRQYRPTPRYSLSLYLIVTGSQRSYKENVYTCAGIYRSRKTLYCN
jgi:hypothetical protein